MVIFSFVKTPSIGHYNNVNTTPSLQLHPCFKRLTIFTNNKKHLSFTRSRL